MYQDGTLRQSAGQTPPAAVGAPGSDDHLIVDGRFGRVTVAPHGAITFPRGLLGFADVQSFVLAEPSDERYGPFKVLQCLDDQRLAFLVLPLERKAGLIAAADLATACEHAAIGRTDLAVLLIVSVRRSGEGTAVSANLRAPLLIDTAKRVGVQYVLADDCYPVRHPL